MSSGPGTNSPSGRMQWKWGLPREHRAQEGREHLGQEGGLHGQQEAQFPREGQHPLPVGRLGQYSVDQIGGGLGRAPCPARGAHAALAREGHQPLEPAGGTAQPREAAGQQAAVEVTPELLLDEPGVAVAALAALARLLQQRLQILAHDRVQGGLLGLAALVAAGQRMGRRARLELVDDFRKSVDRGDRHAGRR